VGDHERSTEVFRIDQLVLLTFDLFRVTGLGDVTGFAVLTLEVRVFHEVTVALNATVGKLLTFEFKTYQSKRKRNKF